MKIKKIEVKNFKAIENKEVDFNGCSAIITAGNNKGKSSLLTGLINRFKGEKPNVILREGTENGFNIIELTDGSKIEWKFTDKSESFAFITKEGIKQTTGVLKTIGEKYFGMKFSIDNFISSSQAEQAKMLCKLLNIDLTDINERYNKAYEERTDAKKELTRIISLKKEEPVVVENVNTDDLLEEKRNITSENEAILKKYNEDNERHIQSIVSFNKEQVLLSSKSKIANECINSLKELGFESDDLNTFAASFNPKPEKALSQLHQPEIISTYDIDMKIEDANNKIKAYDRYILDKEQYDNWVKECKQARQEVEKCENKVADILAERTELLNNSKMPEDFTITESGLLYKNMKLDKNQLSLSSIYIAALKLGRLSLGELETMHFEASALDRKSLQEVQNWADGENLQLLIERPDFDGGEIKYEIIQ